MTEPPIRKHVVGFVRQMKLNKEHMNLTFWVRKQKFNYRYMGDGFQADPEIPMAPILGYKVGQEIWIGSRNRQPLLVVFDQQKNNPPIIRLVVRFPLAAQVRAAARGESVKAILDLEKPDPEMVRLAEEVLESMRARKK